MLLEDQFPSNVFVWRELAAQSGGQVRTVTWAEAAGGSNSGTDWTSALLEAIGDRTAIVAAAHCHWTDGSIIDLEQVSKQCRRHGAALVLDITQSGGAWPFDVEVVRPDFLICACYKWLLGPYTLGFLYVDEKWHGGEPLEYNWIARDGSENFSGLVDYRDAYQPGAQRFRPRRAREFPPYANGGGSARTDPGVECRGDRKHAFGPDRRHRGSDGSTRSRS